MGHFIVISGTVFTSRLLEVVHRLGLMPLVAGGWFAKGVFCLLFRERPRKNQSKLSGLCSSDPCSLRAPLRPRGDALGAALGPVLLAALAPRPWCWPRVQLRRCLWISQRWFTSEEDEPCFLLPFLWAATLFPQNSCHPYKVTALKSVVRRTLNGSQRIGEALHFPSLASCTYKAFRGLFRCAGLAHR